MMLIDQLECHLCLKLLFGKEQITMYNDQQKNYFHALDELIPDDNDKLSLKWLKINQVH